MLDPAALECTLFPDRLSDVSFQEQTAPRTKTLADDIQKLGRILRVNIKGLRWRKQYVVKANVGLNLSFYCL
jgi:hypothetical protein